ADPIAHRALRDGAADVQPEAPEDRREVVGGVARAAETAQDDEAAAIEDPRPPRLDVAGDGLQRDVLGAAAPPRAAARPRAARGRPRASSNAARWTSVRATEYASGLGKSAGRHALRAMTGGRVEVMAVSSGVCSERDDRAIRHRTARPQRSVSTRDSGVSRRG